MCNKAAVLIVAALIVGAGALRAETPLSAIDWLSDSVAAPRAATPSGQASDVSLNALPDDVSVSQLAAVTPDMVGLSTARVAALPRDLWGSSSSADLARRFRADRVDLLPAMQDLLYALLLREYAPPTDTGPQATLFLARIDTLLALGALNEAEALLHLAGGDQPQIFRREFDVSLLLRRENSACATLRATPALSPTFPARIFCLARGGDWNAAALSLEVGRALGYLSPQEDSLLERFLDPALSEGQPRLTPPVRPSPLVFRMFEAIGEPLPTSNMPRAFAFSDLQGNSGWKAELEAAERLTRTGALAPEVLLDLYGKGRPAASGGLWDRVTAVQALDAALATGAPAQISAALPAAWQQMSRAELEVPFALLFSKRLAAAGLPPADAPLLFEIALLSDGYRDVAPGYEIKSERDTMLLAIAQGRAATMRSDDPLLAAIRDGFRARGVPVRLQSLIDEKRLGAAILRAMELFASGARGDLDELSDALAFFRAVGLSDTAQRAALQLLLLERRG